MITTAPHHDVYTKTEVGMSRTVSEKESAALHTSR